MTGTRGELAGPDWIEVTIKFIFKYLLLLSAPVFLSQIYFYLILDLQSGHGRVSTPLPTTIPEICREGQRVKIDIGDCLIVEQVMLNLTPYTILTTLGRRRRYSGDSTIVTRPTSLKRNVLAVS